MELACIGYDGKGDEAAKLYGELVATVPQVWDLHILLAIAYIDLQRSQEGIEVAGRLLSMGPDDGTRATALYLQSAAYAELGMKSKAIELLERVREIEGTADTPVAAGVSELLAELGGETGSMQPTHDTGRSMAPDEARE